MSAVKSRTGRQWPDLASIVDPMVESFMQQTATPGAIVSVQIEGNTAYEKGYGQATDGGPLPNSDTAFQIDSLSKALTGIAVLRLLELGGITSLDDPLGLYVKTLPNGVSISFWSGITIRQLLGMASGIPDQGSSTDTYAQILESIANQTSFSPGTCYEYSNPNYMLLGMVIDAVHYDGCDYATFLRRYVLDAFGLGPDIGLLEESQVAHPAQRSENGTWVAGWRSPLCGYSAGGLCSTMRDLEIFAGALGQREVLSPAVYDLLWNRYALTGPCDCVRGGITAVTPFGCGWSVSLSPTGAPQQVAKNGGGYDWGSQITIHLADYVRQIPAVSMCAMINAATGADTLVNPILAAIVQAIAPTG
jgi:CubicO group peptidase (beta-lactamase class C family)